MKAIPTTYCGCRMRSRLEAQWGVVFTSLGIEWLYEPEGFSHVGKTYLPDFELIPWRCFASIKPAGCGESELNRELWWQDEMEGNGYRLLIFQGQPRPGQYRILIPEYDEPATLMDCRRCDGVCLVFDSGMMDIGIHTCGDHDKWPADTTRLDAALLCAMRERFGERGSGAVKMGLKVGAGA